MRRARAADQTPRLDVELRPQDVVLGVLGEYVQPSESVWSGGLVQLLVDLGFAETASRVALQRLARRGLLERSQTGRLVHYKIGPRLAALHDEGRRRIFSFAEQEAWRGSWTVVWHAVPDGHLLARRRFSRRLAFLGFGSLQDSTWLAPGDRRREVRALLDELGLAPFASIMVGRMTVVDALRQVERAWDLELLTRSYDRFLETFPNAGGTSPNREAFVQRTQAIEAFRRLVPLDPRLPDDFLGRTWRRSAAIERFRTLVDALRAPAARHVRQTLQLP